MSLLKIKFKNVRSHQLYTSILSFVFYTCLANIIVNPVIAESLSRVDWENTVCWNRWETHIIDGLPVPVLGRACNYAYITICPYGQWSTNFDQYMQAGCKAYRERDWNTAIINFQRALRQQPNSKDASVALSSAEESLEAQKRTQQSFLQQQAQLYKVLNAEREWYSNRCESRYDLSGQCKDVAQYLVSLLQVQCSVAETNVCQQASSRWAGWFTSPEVNKNRNTNLLEKHLIPVSSGSYLNSH